MARSSTVRLSGEEVLALLEDEQDEEGCPDKVFCPGSDEELGFLEEEEDMDQLRLVQTVDTFEVNKDITEDALSYRDEEEQTFTATATPGTVTVRAKDIKWSTNLTPITVNPCTVQAGPRVEVPHVAKEIFFLFFTTTIMDIKVEETNRYATAFLRDQPWTPITTSELSAYLGFVILMGLVKLPYISDYWAKDEVFHYSPVADRISRDRFFEIHQFIHFTNNASLPAPGTPGYDRLGKVRPILTELGKCFASIYTVGQDISVDEAMIPFKGRSSLKQYLPKKPVKRGFKVWMHADAKNGYVSAFEVYTGKKESVEKGLGANVVKTLSCDLHHTNRHLYFDNYFSSVDLILDLQRVGLYGCGTLRSNRVGFPADLKPYTKKGLTTRGDSKTVQNGNVTVTLWQDTRPVIMIASNSDPTVMETVQRKQRDGTRVSVSCPASIVLYNKHMGGVDHNDQLRGYYTSNLKFRKYYKYIFWFLVNVAITNSFILSKERSSLNIKNIKMFRITLAKELIGGYCSCKRAGRPCLLPTKKFCKDHFPTRGNPQGRRCCYCYTTRRVRHTTTWFCKDCQVYLCHSGRDDDCFILYHQQQGPHED